MLDPAQDRERWGALQTLPLAALSRVCNRLGIRVGDRRAIQAHVDAMLETSTEWREVVLLLKRSELKQLCRALHVDDSGKERASLVLRLTAGGTRSGAPDDFVAVPYDLPSGMRTRLRERYEALKSEVDDTHHRYVFAHIHAVLRRLHKKDATWMRSLAGLATALLDLYCQEATDPRAARAILAALHYLCAPDDLIPDYQPGGYADDAFILNLCAREVCVSQERLRFVVRLLEHST